MLIERLHIKTEEDTIAAVQTAYVRKGSGLRRSIAQKPCRQVSLMAGELRPMLPDLGGLCTDRFDADIITAGLDYALLAPGTVLKIGTVRLAISDSTKRCFDQCPIRQAGRICPLPNSCAFAQVLDEGELSVGDRIELI